ncbi:MAG: restriction endonuclease subunit S, partial [Betaproteobacteria bacterium]|nr:restriction endonuclease subunit S [Betaproteobacteria bacterium]
MAGEWREATVDEIASSARNALVGGPFGSNLVSQDYVDHGVPVIRGQNMGERWVTGEFAHVTPAKAESLEANLARPGDIVFTQRGTLGQVSLVPDGQYERYLVSQSQMKLTVDRQTADPLFFYYVFRSAEQREYVRQHAIQTGVPHTNLGILRATPVPLPPIAEQRAIARILGTLDDKIELNRRMNETLEAIARALFKSWFVDFDPVHARAEGRDPGRPKHLADLFPDSFGDSEVGEIPGGWRAGNLGEVAENPRRGVQPSQIEPSTPYIGLEHMPRRCIALSDWGHADTLESNKFGFRRGEILFGKLRPYFHKIGVAPVDGVCSTDILVVVPKEPHWFVFVL